MIMRKKNKLKIPGNLLIVEQSSRSSWQRGRSGLCKAAVGLSLCLAVHQDHSITALLLLYRVQCSPVYRY